MQSASFACSKVDKLEGFPLSKIKKGHIVKTRFVTDCLFVSRVGSGGMTVA